MPKGKEKQPLSLREARAQGRLAEFIEEHSEELAEDEEFIRLLERIERDEKPPRNRMKR